MKKILLVLPLLFLTACQPKTPTAQIDQTESETINEAQQMGKLVAEGKPVACVVTDKKTNASYTYKMIGKKVRMSGITTTGQTGKSSMLLDEQNMYMWDEEKKTGTKWAIPTEDDAKKTAEQQGRNIPDLSTEESREEYINQGYAVDCEETVVTDSDFIPPADVTFSDLSSMMDSANQMMQNPTATLTPAQQEMLQKQSEEMMMQYQQ